MALQAVEPRFFEQATHRLAFALLGKILVHGAVGGRIVEVEAYQGPADRGAHSFGGRPTPRTAVMYGGAGHAYVYLIYGRYHCFNVVSGPVGQPEAILIRALEPLFGLSAMQRRRGGPMDIALTSGPGRIGEALAIDRTCNGHPLWQTPLYIADDGYLINARRVRQGPRIGLGNAGDAKAFPWRYWIADHPSVSR